MICNIDIIQNEDAEKNRCHGYMELY